MLRRITLYICVVLACFVLASHADEDEIHLIEVTGTGIAATPATMVRVSVNLNLRTENILDRESLLRSATSGPFGTISERNATLDKMVQDHLNSRYRTWTASMASNPETWGNARDAHLNLYLKEDVVYHELERRLASLANFLTRMHETLQQSNPERNHTVNIDASGTINAADAAASTTSSEAIHEHGGILSSEGAIKLSTGDFDLYSVVFRTRAPQVRPEEVWSDEFRRTLNRGYNGNADVSVVLPLSKLPDLVNYVRGDESATLTQTRLDVHTAASRAVRAAAEKAALADAVARARRSLIDLGLVDVADTLYPHRISLHGGASKPAPRIADDSWRAPTMARTMAFPASAPLDSSEASNVRLPNVGDEVVSTCTVQMSFRIPESAAITQEIDYGAGAGISSAPGTM